jgi:hypothetical protein
MPTLGVPSISSLILTHPSLVNEVIGEGLAHILYSHTRSRRRNRTNRRERRKVANRRRRWFVDNIIMHHRRLHERNRELAVSKARDRVVARRGMLKKENLQPSQSARSFSKEKPERENWKERVSLKERGAEIRGRTDLRKMRARSRWLTLSDSSSNS